MARPQFTPEEQYVIASCLSETRTPLSFDLSYMVPSYLLAAYGWVTGQIEPLVLALCIVALFKIWQWMHGRKYAGCWKSILRKYEEAMTGEPNNLAP